jgi:hypothetical protein
MIDARPATQRALAIKVPQPVPDPTERIAADLKALGL